MNRTVQHRTSFRRALLVALVVAGAGSAASSQAGQATATMTMGATVAAACTVTGGSIAFTSIDALSATATDLAGTLSATCTSGSPYAIGMSAGNSNDATARTMLNTATGSTATLKYVLSSVAYNGASWPIASGTVAGDTAAGMATGTGTGVAQTIPVYAEITGGQNTVVAGTYADTLTATIDF